MTDRTIKAPWHLWLVGVIAVLFNAIGVFDFVMNMVQGPSYLASAGMTPEQVAHYQDMPTWMTAVWAIGVWGAMMGQCSSCCATSSPLRCSPCHWRHFCSA